MPRCLGSGVKRGEVKWWLSGFIRDLNREPDSDGYTTCGVDDVVCFVRAPFVESPPCSFALHALADFFVEIELPRSDAVQLSANHHTWFAVASMCNENLQQSRGVVVSRLEEVSKRWDLLEQPRWRTFGAPVDWPTCFEAQNRGLLVAWNDGAKVHTGEEALAVAARLRDADDAEVVSRVERAFAHLNAANRLDLPFAHVLRAIDRHGLDMFASGSFQVLSLV